MTIIAADLIGIFLDTITALFAGIGSGVQNIFTALIYDPEAGGLTNLAEWSIIFMGIGFGLAIFNSLFRKIA